MSYHPLISTLAAIALATPLAAQHTWSMNPATGHWYALTTTPMSWVDAQAEAASVGGYLATVNDAAENAWIYSSFGANEVNGHGPWLGLYQNRNSGSFSEPGGGWEWIHGEAMTFNNWATGEPNNNGGSEDFGHFHGSVAGGSRWNDAPVDLFGGIWGIIEIDHNPALSLQVTGLAVGSSPIFTVHGANSGDRIGFAYSLAGNGPSNVTTPCGSFTLELSNPMRLLGFAFADAAGVATLTGPVIPTGALNRTVHFDTINTTSCVSSPGVTLQVQ